MKMPTEIKLVLWLCVMLAAIIAGRLMLMRVEAQEKPAVAKASTNTIGNVKILLTNGVPEKIQITDTPVAAFMVDGASANIVGKTIRVEMKP